MRVLLGALLINAFIMVPGHADAAERRAPEVWFFMRGSDAPARGVDWRAGWERLFLTPASPWPVHMNRVDVVAISSKVSDQLLTKAIAILKQKHIALALEILAQSWVGQPPCGDGVESYTDPPGNAVIARRIKDAGGELTYVAMDEPLYFGHYYAGRNACRSSIENAAQRAAAIVRVYQREFPHVAIGDTEPFPALAKQPGWQDAYRRWMRAFEQAVGQPIGFLILDINWPEDDGHWRQSVDDAFRFASVNRLPMGIIYNASLPGGARSDEEWLDSAVRNFTQIEGTMGLRPDKVLFDSWDNFPTHSLTDQSGPGEDELVRRYLQLRPGGSRRQP